MATTIQLKEETKKALFLEKNRLEQELGYAITYDDVIDHLLKKIAKTTTKKKLQQFQGTLDREAVKIYSELKKEYRKNE